MRSGRDYWLEKETAKQDAVCPVEWMDAEDPLFILYTSGSTGKPRAWSIPPPVICSTSRLPINTSSITSLAISIFAPRISAGSRVIAILFTDRSPMALPRLCSNQRRFTRIRAAIGRSLRATGSTFFIPRQPRFARLPARAMNGSKNNDRSSLRVLGTVGEPINPEAWEWSLSRGRRGPLRHCRHLVANRDGRDYGSRPSPASPI